MVIEFLTFRVDPAAQDAFIEWDDRFWTAALSRCKGYGGKELWRNRTHPDQLHCVIRWDTWEDWQGIDPGFLQAVEQAFQAKLQDLQIQAVLLDSQAFDRL